MQYTLNSQLIDNQTHPYQSAMIALHSRTDAFDLATTGSGALMSLAKDTAQDFRPSDPGAGNLAKGDEAKLLNPKCAILQEFYQSVAQRASSPIPSHCQRPPSHRTAPLHPRRTTTTHPEHTDSPRRPSHPRTGAYTGYTPSSIIIIIIIIIINITHSQ